MNDDMLGVVDAWLGGTDENASGTKQPLFEKRPQRLGLGAKYVPHKKVLMSLVYYSRKKQRIVC